MWLDVYATGLELIEAEVFWEKHKSGFTKKYFNTKN